MTLRIIGTIIIEPGMIMNNKAFEADNDGNGNQFLIKRSCWNRNRSLGTFANLCPLIKKYFH
jgi:hypothetical protein